MKESIEQILAVLTKEIKSEFRTRYAISAVLLFILTTVTMIVFATAGEEITSDMASGILWVIMFFGAMTGLSKSFVSEEERGTSFLLQISANPISVYFGKLLFNIILSLSLNIFSVFLFFIFNNSITVVHLSDFLIVLLLGSVGLTGATTIISALISKANTKNALFPVLSFPVILPLIVLGIKITKYTFDSGLVTKIGGDFQMITAYCGIMITASFFLFDLVWRD